MSASAASGEDISQRTAFDPKWTSLKKMQCAEGLANLVTADACRPIVSGEPGFASGILSWNMLGKINPRDQPASFAGNGSQKRVANSASTSQV